MVYTFHTPFGADETCNIIKRTIMSMCGNVKEVSPGYLQAKWRTQPYHSKQFHTIFPSSFSFHIGDGVVRAVTGNTTMQMLPMRYHGLGGIHIVWNAFIESLIKTVPGVDFGIKPGVPEMVAIQFFGDGTEQVFVSTTRNSPSLGGAALGGLLFGSTGAIIGSTAGTSYTTGRSSTRFSNEVLARARYSNGLVADGKLSTNSPAYHQIMVNMNRLSETE